MNPLELAMTIEKLDRGTFRRDPATGLYRIPGVVDEVTLAQLDDAEKVLVTKTNATWKAH